VLIDHGWRGCLRLAIDAHAQADCLVDEAVSVNIGHETNIDLGGYNDAGNWAAGPYSKPFEDTTFTVKSFTYWKPGAPAASTPAPEGGGEGEADGEGEGEGEDATTLATTTTAAPTTASAAPVCSRLEGDDGRGGDLGKRYHGGAMLKQVHRKHSPDGAAWKWWECAAECAREKLCNYWYVPKKTKNCAMRKRKGAALVASSFNSAGEGLGHGDTDPNCDGVDPEAACHATPQGCDKCEESRIEDNSGFFGGGANLKLLRKTDAPNGRVWAWYA